MVKCADESEGVVIACGSPVGFPDVSSIAIRHRFMLPPRSLTK
jgi:hypothetical protein